MKPVGVLRFPGTNCDRDVFAAVISARGGSQVEKGAVWLWHADRFDPRAFSQLILPGGFSYGDYLRSGALAARSVAMKSVREACEYGVPILGICNGFQILCEAGLLPGVLVRNSGLRFIDDWVELQLENRNPGFAQSVPPGARVKLPIAHADGRFYCPSDELKLLQDRGQVWWSYRKNPNGSLCDIAGVMNEKKNVAGLMPHPERALHTWMGGTDGESFFAAV